MISTASAEVRTGTISKSIKSRQFAIHLSNSAKSSVCMSCQQVLKPKSIQLEMVFQSFGHHSAPLSEASVNFGCSACFETLDNHVKHGFFVVAGVAPAIFNSAAGTAASTANYPAARRSVPTSYFSSSFTSANAFVANSKSSRECAAETCVRTRALPCGTIG